MKAKRLFLANVEDHIQANNLALKKPPVKTLELDYYFELKLVTEAFITSDNVIDITIQGKEVLLKNEPKVWSKIKSHLE